MRLSELKQGNQHQDLADYAWTEHAVNKLVNYLLAITSRWFFLFNYMFFILDPRILGGTAGVEQFVATLVLTKGENTKGIELRKAMG